MQQAAADKGFDAQALELRGVPYLDFLRHLNRQLRPRSYLEIGSDNGDSLACFDCDAIAVDPSFKLTGKVAGQRKRTLLFQMTSDDFFRDQDTKRYIPDGLDVAFLDGMHRVEYLLRDFTNAERVCHPRSIILLHDCLPLNDRMAGRQYSAGQASERFRNYWTGDVWKMLPILRQYRPDLRVITLDCPPTGLVAVTRLDPASSVLANAYHEIVDAFSMMSLEAFGLGRLFRDWPAHNSRALLERDDMLTGLLTLR